MVNYDQYLVDDRKGELLYILVIDDNEELLYGLQQLLRDAHYHVDVATTILSGSECLNHKKYDLILLDWMLPDGSGIDLLTRLRREKITTPILLFSSKKEVEDKIEALDGGADDYLEKPFSNIELLARIRALLRRESTQKQTFITINNLTVDFSTRSVLIDNNPVKLSAKEFELLELLVLNTNTVLTRYQISEHLHRDFDHLSASNIVDAHIKNLRKKLNADSLIETVRGVGYRIVH